METKIENILKKYYLINTLKYKITANDSEANKIFNSLIMAVGLHSEIYVKEDLGELLKEILITESEDKLGTKLGLDYKKTYNNAARMAIFAGRDFEYINLVIKSLNKKACRNILDLYYKNTVLKEQTRKGWQHWSVKSNRLESISEHVYGACMLALIMHDSGCFDVDINKVISMLAIHETEEITIGDRTPFESNYQDKEIEGHKAIKEILSNLNNKEELVNLILEFDKKETKEAKFAHLIDKLEADLQVIAYENLGYNHLDNQENNPAFKSSKIQEIIKNGATSVADVWYQYDSYHYENDPIFQKVLNKAIKKNQN